MWLEQMNFDEEQVNELVRMFRTPRRVLLVSHLLGVLTRISISHLRIVTPI